MNFDYFKEFYFLEVTDINVDIRNVINSLMRLISVRKRPIALVKQR